MISKRRSLVKSVTWRVVAVLVTFLVGLIMTGNLEFALSLSLVSNFVNFVLYYFHERVWLRIKWGKR